MNVWLKWLKIALRNFPFYNWTLYKGKVYTFSKWETFVFFGRTWHTLYWDNPKGLIGKELRNYQKRK